MISLKNLLIFMGSVSVLMMVAVVAVKVNNPDHVSFAEVRAIDRLCHRFADDMMKEIYKDDASGDEKSRLHELHTCMVSCRNYLIVSRAKSSSAAERDQLKIPACFGERLSNIALDARRDPSDKSDKSDKSDTRRDKSDTRPGQVKHTSE